MSKPYNTFISMHHSTLASNATKLNALVYFYKAYVAEMVTKDSNQISFEARKKFYEEQADKYDSLVLNLRKKNYYNIDIVSEIPIDEEPSGKTVLSPDQYDQMIINLKSEKSCILFFI